MSAPIIEPPLRQPTDLRRGDLRQIAQRLMKAVGDDNLAALASGLAYNLFLALFPSLLAVIAIYGLVREPAEVTAQINRLAETYPVLPEQVLTIVRDVVDSIVQDEANGTVALLGIAGGIVASSGAAAALINALNRAYGVREGRNFLRLRLLGLLIALTLLGALIALVVTIVLGAQVRDWLIPEEYQGVLVRLGFGAVQFLVALVLLIAFFAFIYWIGPYRERPPWQWLSGGTVFSVVGWLVVSGGFAIYTANFNNYDNPIYAGFGGIIVLLLWLQLSMLVVLLGAELNAELEHLRNERAAARAAALGEAAAAAPAPVPRDA
jgi:membrane protein